MAYMGQNTKLCYMPSHYVQPLIHIYLKFPSCSASPYIKLLPVSLVIGRLSNLKTSQDSIVYGKYPDWSVLGLQPNETLTSDIWTLEGVNYIYRPAFLIPDIKMSLHSEIYISLYDPLTKLFQLLRVKQQLIFRLVGPLI